MPCTDADAATFDSLDLAVSATFIETMQHAKRIAILHKRWYHVYISSQCCGTKLHKHSTYYIAGLTGSQLHATHHH